MEENISIYRHGASLKSQVAMTSVSCYNYLMKALKNFYEPRRNQPHGACFVCSNELSCQSGFHKCGVEVSGFLKGCFIVLEYVPIQHPLN